MSWSSRPIAAERIKPSGLLTILDGEVRWRYNLVKGYVIG